jgi:drug/metabolite transporter (DMT)-like permease
VPATRAALTINLVPAVAILTGWFALGETMVPLQVAACGLIIGSVVLAEIASRRAAAPRGSEPAEPARPAEAAETAKG